MNIIPSQYLERTCFADLSSLKILAIYSNRINWIEYGAFGGLHSLKTLDLHNNRLNSSIFTPNAFIDVAGSLTSLDLRFNPVTTIYNDTFSSFNVLELLRMSGFDIVEPNGFRGLNSIQTLELLYIKWDRLKSNALSDISYTLTKLSIQDSPMESMYEDMFGMMPRLKTLNFMFCGIETIHPETFSGLKNLEELSFEQNRLSEEQIKQLESLPSSLKSISLGYNRITAIGNGTFEGFLTLEHLSLGGNQISVLILGGFYGLQSLTRLDLSYNVIYAIEPGSFEGLSSLTDLSLIGNNIAEIHPESFRGLKLLHNLDLSSNRTTEKEVMYLQNIQSTLTYLHLSRNRITAVKKDTFEGFTVLKRLNLANNQISEIVPGAFQDLSSLRRIDLDHNSLTTLDWTAFNPTCALHPGKKFPVLCPKTNQTCFGFLLIEVFANNTNLILLYKIDKKGFERFQWELSLQLTSVVSTMNACSDMHHFWTA